MTDVLQISMTATTPDEDHFNKMSIMTQNDTADTAMDISELNLSIDNKQSAQDNQAEHVNDTSDSTRNRANNDTMVNNDNKEHVIEESDSIRADEDNMVNEYKEDIIETCDTLRADGNMVIDDNKEHFAEANIDNMVNDDNNDEHTIEICDSTCNIDGNMVKPLTQEEIDTIVWKHAKMADKEKQMYLNFFWSIDTGKLGVFNIHQLACRLRNTGVSLENRLLAKMFCDLDANMDLLVSLEEYLEEMSKPKRKSITTEDLKLWFKRFDRDQNGFVVAEDIYAIIEEHDMYIMSAEVEDLMKFDHSGKAKKLNLDDFCYAVKKLMKLV